MGSFNYTDYVSRTPILEEWNEIENNEKYLVSLLQLSPRVQHSPEDFTQTLSQNMVYINDHYQPIILPYIGTYNAYGAFIIDNTVLNQMIYNLNHLLDQDSDVNLLKQLITCPKSQLTRYELPENFTLTDRDQPEDVMFPTCLAATRLSPMDELFSQKMGSGQEHYDNHLKGAIEFWTDLMQKTQKDLEDPDMRLFATFEAREAVQHYRYKHIFNPVIVTPCHINKNGLTIGPYVFAHIALIKHLELHKDDDETINLINYLRMIQTQQMFQDALNIPFQPVAGLGTQEVNVKELIQYAELIQKDAHNIITKQLPNYLDDCSIEPRSDASNQELEKTNCEKFKTALSELNLIDLYAEHDDHEIFVEFLNYEQSVKLWNVTQEISHSLYPWSY